MGTWRLEAFRMALYVSFPVAVFHLFNTPEFFEKFVGTKITEFNQPTDPNLIQPLEDLKAKIRKRREDQIESEFLQLKSRS